MDGMYKMFFWPCDPLSQKFDKALVHFENEPVQLVPLVFFCKNDKH